MAGIEMDPPQFIPYKINIRTKKEHDFLFGLFQGNTGAQKENCINYDLKIDKMFFDLLKNPEEINRKR